MPDLTVNRLTREAITAGLTALDLGPKFVHKVNFGSTLTANFGEDGDFAERNDYPGFKYKKIAGVWIVYERPTVFSLVTVAGGGTGNLGTSVIRYRDDTLVAPGTGAEVELWRASIPLDIVPPGSWIEWSAFVEGFGAFARTSTIRTRIGEINTSLTIWSRTVQGGRRFLDSQRIMIGDDSVAYNSLSTPIDMNGAATAENHYVAAPLVVVGRSLSLTAQHTQDVVDPTWETRVRGLRVLVYPPAILPQTP